jgi:murein DD-endopeptidase MepM/ murein hydrolase activator NlpD
MKKFKLKIMSAIIIGSAIVGICYPTQITVAADGELTDATVQSYEDQIADIQRKKDQALDELASIQTDKSNTWSTITELDKVIEYNNQMKTLAEGQMDELDKSISQKNADIEDKENKIEKQENAFLQRMVDVYMDENSDYIEILLGSESLIDFLTKLDYVNAVFDYDADVITELKVNKEALEADKVALDDQLEIQQLRVADYENAIQENQAAYEDKLNYMSNLEENEADWIETYNYNKELEEQLNSELENYLAELQKKSQSVYIGGDVGWPLDANASYYVSSEQGWRDLYGVQDYHLGIDLACANGTDVFAANGGTVLKSEMHWSYGNYVLIDHGGGISTLYAHMSDRLVSAGDTVSAGQIIGHVGLTGNTFGYHLHFEVRENGTVVNPRNYLVFP